MTETRKLNIELLKKVRERIATTPESYSQLLWAKRDAKAPCGTTACLAGEAIICSQPTVEAGVKLLWDTLSDASTPPPDLMAKELLGLDQRQATAMFTASACGWPAPFSVQFDKARGDKAKAEVAVAYLDHIIETGNVLD